MGRLLRRSVLWSLPMLALLAASGAAEPSKRLKLAVDLARAHAAWPRGRDWLKPNQARASELLTPVLHRCVPDAPDGELTAFSVYIRLSEGGKLAELVTDVDVTLDGCMRKEAREVQFPEPPRKDFWLKLNFAAKL